MGRGDGLAIRPPQTSTVSPAWAAEAAFWIVWNGAASDVPALLLEPVVATYQVVDSSERSSNGSRRSGRRGADRRRPADLPSPLRPSSTAARVRTKKSPCRSPLGPRRQKQRRSSSRQRSGKGGETGFAGRALYQMCGRERNDLASFLRRLGCWQPLRLAPLAQGSESAFRNDHSAAIRRRRRRDRLADRPRR